MIPCSHKHVFWHKNQSITLVKLVKSKLKIFHTRVCHLVMTFSISATTEPIWKKFEIFRKLISTPASIYKMVS